MDVFTQAERAEIEKLFGLAPEQLNKDNFRQVLRELRVKYHPDNFEKFGDDTVRTLATERFQDIERLAAKIEDWLNGQLHVEKRPPNSDPIFGKDARFAVREMKIELRTSDKDLKYHLFGSFYRWLMLGDKFKIPETGAWLIADEGHAGHRIGFQETIRLYLTFGESDSVETIVGWLFSKIAGRADSLIIEGDVVPIEYPELLLAVKRRSFLRLEAAA